MGQQGFSLLTSLVQELTVLVEAAAELQHPQIMWKAMETGEWLPEPR